MPICTAPEGCDREQRARGYCGKHYQRMKRLGTTALERWDPVCSVDGCDQKHRSNGFCARHYMRWWKTGDPGPIESTRRRAPERTVTRDGYVLLRRAGHPRADKAGMVLEHIVVMEAVLGRAVVRGEEVHHKNGVRGDNRPENLELWVVSQPKGQRPADLVAWAKEILERYDTG